MHGEILMYMCVIVFVDYIFDLNFELFCIFEIFIMMPCFFVIVA